MSTVAQRLEIAAEALERYVALEREFAEGGPGDVVETPNGTYPTLAGLVAQGREAAELLTQANTILSDAQVLRDAAHSSALDAADSAMIANNQAAALNAAIGVTEYHHGRALLLGGERY